jgi:hypothetical protein
LSKANPAKDSVVVASQDHEAQKSFSRQPKSWKNGKKTMQRLDESQRTREISNSANLDDVMEKAKENKFKRAESNCEV